MSKTAVKYLLEEESLNSFSSMSDYGGGKGFVSNVCVIQFLVL